MLEREIRTRAAMKYLYLYLVVIVSLQSAFSDNARDHMVLFNLAGKKLIYFLMTVRE